MQTTISQSAAGKKEKIGLGERLAYGCGDAGFNIIWGSLTAFIVFFFTDIAGIPPAIVGVILLVGRIFDGSDDVVAGWLVDRTRSRFGKARPWLLWLVVPFGILTVMLFTVPNLGLTGKIIYAGVIYFVLNDMYSFINIPYGTLNAMITQDQYQRSMLNLFRMIMAIVATIFVTSATIGFVKMLGGGAPAWQRLYIIYAVVAVIMLLITFLFTRERVKVMDGTKPKSTVPFKVAFLALLKNRFLWLIIGTMILAFISQGLGGATIFFAQYVMGNVQLMAVLQLAANVPVLLGMFTLAPLIAAHGDWLPDHDHQSKESSIHFDRFGYQSAWNGTGGWSGRCHGIGYHRIWGLEDGCPLRRVNFKHGKPRLQVWYRFRRRHDRMDSGWGEICCQYGEPGPNGTHGDSNVLYLPTCRHVDNHPRAALVL
jgi:GPH family glycoside/pentoside/hexuronide:cation symporter